MIVHTSSGRTDTKTGEILEPLRHKPRGKTYKRRFNRFMWYRLKHDAKVIVITVLIVLALT